MIQWCKEKKNTLRPLISPVSHVHQRNGLASGCRHPRAVEEIPLQGRKKILSCAINK